MRLTPWALYHVKLSVGGCFSMHWSRPSRPHAAPKPRSSRRQDYFRDEAAVPAGLRSETSLSKAWDVQMLGAA
eukprot:15466781-Alexandrium_andersonii.AAC.1